MIFLIILPIILVLLYVTFRYIAYYYNRKNDFPHLPPDLIFGNLLQTNELNGEARCKVWSQFQKQYGDIFAYYYSMYERIIVFSKVEDAQYIYKTRHIYATPKFVERFFGVFTKSGIISSDEEKHKSHARIMLPLLKQMKTLNNINMIVQSTDRLIAKWQTRNEGKNKLCTTLVSDMRQLVSEIMLLVLFGDKCFSSSHLFNRLIGAANACVEFVQRFIYLPPFCIKLYLKYSFSCKKYRQAIDVLRTYSSQVIDDYVESKEKITLEAENTTLLSSLLSSTLLNDNDHYLQYKWSKNDVIDEMIMFILASQETPTSALSWFVFLMSKHPHIQQKMKDELKSQGINRTTELNTELLDGLEFCDCVLKELLRYAPISGPSVRTAVQDDIIDGMKIRKGDHVLIATSNMHWDPRYWNAEPSLFYPERFLNEDIDHHPFAYVPFGGGPLMCPGQKLARLELKVSIVRLMQFVTFIDGGEKNGNTGGYLQKLTCLPKSVAIYIDFDN